MDVEWPQPSIEIETAPRPDASVIWLHGLGADGNDLAAIVPELSLSRSLAVRFVFPDAPYRPVTVNGGQVMRAWYDIEMTDTGFNQKLSHIRESEAFLRGLIDAQIARGVPVERVVLAGFSQGGAIALVTGLHFPKRLAGIMALSAPVPLAGSLMGQADPANSQIPIFMAHGNFDGIIPFPTAQAARNLLAGGGAQIEWHEYPMEHTICAAEIKDMSSWLAARFTI
ncbi:MAG: alpha/beta hydrolase-fold protein [Pseudomonadota bacterium]|nr:alpha/beta hydrolase-fold protein [Pseudomonadota bacterium]